MRRTIPWLYCRTVLLLCATSFIASSKQLPTGFLTCARPCPNSVLASNVLHGCISTRRCRCEITCWRSCVDKLMLSSCNIVAYAFPHHFLAISGNYNIWQDMSKQKPCHCQLQATSQPCPECQLAVSIMLLSTVGRLVSNAVRSHFGLAF